MPLTHPAIQYAAAPAHDRVAALAQRLAAGSVQLHYDEAHGYLRSILKELDIPLPSQVLVFSKTSFQAPPYLAAKSPSTLLH